MLVGTIASIRTASIGLLAVALLVVAPPARAQRGRRGRPDRVEQEQAPERIAPVRSVAPVAAAGSDTPIEISLTPAPEIAAPTGPVISFGEAVRIAERSHPDALTARAA